MTHRDVLTTYKNMFPWAANGITEWFPNGKNSVRIRFNNDRSSDLVFTFNKPSDWCIETVDSFIRSMKGK